MTSTLAGKRAVVVGAGIAGLSAAGALADYFEHIVVLERDSLPLEATHRTGTPQSSSGWMVRQRFRRAVTARKTRSLAAIGVQFIAPAISASDRSS